MRRRASSPLLLSCLALASCDSCGPSWIYPFFPEDMGEDLATDMQAPAELGPTPDQGDRPDARMEDASQPDQAEMGQSPCTPTTDADDEDWRCDGQDNDCDGQIDEACCAQPSPASVEYSIATTDPSQTKIKLLHLGKQPLIAPLNAEGPLVYSASRALEALSAPSLSTLAPPWSVAVRGAHLYVGHPSHEQIYTLAPQGSSLEPHKSYATLARARNVTDQINGVLDISLYTNQEMLVSILGRRLPTTSRLNLFVYRPDLTDAELTTRDYNLDLIQSHSVDADLFPRLDSSQASLEHPVLHYTSTTDAIYYLTPQSNVAPPPIEAAVHTFPALTSFAFQKADQLIYRVVAVYATPPQSGRNALTVRTGDLGSATFDREVEIIPRNHLNKWPAITPVKANGPRGDEALAVVWQRDRQLVYAVINPYNPGVVSPTVISTHAPNSDIYSTVLADERGLRVAWFVVGEPGPTKLYLQEISAQGRFICGVKP